MLYSDFRWIKFNLLLKFIFQYSFNRKVIHVKLNIRLFTFIHCYVNDYLQLSKVRIVSFYLTETFCCAS